MKKTVALLLILALLPGISNCSGDSNGSGRSDEMRKLKDELSLSPFVIETEKPVAKLFPQGETYGRDAEAADMYILNTGEEYIGRRMGEYFMDVCIDGKWYNLPVQRPVNDMAEGIKPGGYHYQRVRLDPGNLDLPEGRYRVVVKFWYGDEKVHTYYAMEFYISD